MEEKIGQSGTAEKKSGKKKWLIVAAVIVIAAYVDERFVDNCDQKLKIIRVQIASGQNQVNTLKALLAKALP